MKCPLCAAEAQAAFTTTDRNRALSAERFEYSRCGACGTYFLVNVPTDLARYYPSDYYAFPDVSGLDSAARTEASKLALIAKHVTGGRLIEIGPGPGTFARAAHNAGFDVTAIEMDAACCEYLRCVVGVTAIQSAVPHKVLTAGEPANAIALWHVLEHLDRPWPVLEAAAARLERGGVLAIAVPNPESFQFSLLRGRWAHVDAPRHLFLFPYAVLRAQLEDLGLNILQVTSSDPAGMQWNRFGWEYALRRFPARHAATLPIRLSAALLARAMASLEQRGLSGTTYTVLAAKPDR